MKKIPHHRSYVLDIASPFYKVPILGTLRLCTRQIESSSNLPCRSLIRHNFHLRHTFIFPSEFRTYLEFITLAVADKSHVKQLKYLKRNRANVEISYRLERECIRSRYFRFAPKMHTTRLDQLQINTFSLGRTPDPGNF